MKKFIYGLLVFLVSLTVLVVIAANSSYVIKKAADTFAPEYGISYRDITGNILTGVKIEELKFKDHRLAKEIGFSWNPVKLLYKRIAVTQIRAERINVDGIIALVDSFPASEDNGSTAPFPLTVTVGKIYVSVDPFEQQGVAIKKTLLESKDILYATDRLEVGGLRLKLDTNVTDLLLQASLRNGRLNIQDLDIHRLDTVMLRSLIATTDNNQSVETRKSKSKTLNTNTSKSTFIPQRVLIQRLHADILPAVYKPIHIHTLNLNAKALKLDISRLVAEEGTIDLNGTTNLSNISEHGALRNNHFDGHIVLTPNQPLFDLYAPMIRKEAIGDISLDFNASKEKVNVDISAKAKHLFVSTKESNATDRDATDTNTTEPIIVNIDHLNTHLVYDVGSGRLDANLNMAADTPFTQGLMFQAQGTLAKDNLDYSGLLKSDEVLLSDGKQIHPAEDLKVRFKGDLKALKTSISAVGLEGYFNVEDFKKKGHFHLKTTEPVVLREMVTLPSELNATAMNAVIDLPLNFQKLFPLHGTAKLSSNIADINADFLYGKTSTLKLSAIIPQDSLLKQLDKNIRWSAVSPLNATVNVTKEDIAVSINSSRIDAKMKVDPYKEIVEGWISLAGLLTTLETQKDRSVVIRTNVDSISRLLKTVDQFYHIPELPRVEGKADVTLLLSSKRPELLLTLTSPNVIYYADRKTTHDINDVKIVIGSNEKEIRLDSYQLTYNGMKFFSTKPSLIDLQEDQLTIKQIWLNDQLKVTGDVNLKTMEGELLAQADTFHFSHEMIDMDSKIDIKTVFNGENTDIKGKVTLLDGEIHYDLARQTFPTDSDILIVQDMKKKKSSPFMDHLSMAVQIDTQKPLVYKEGAANIKAKADIQIHKAVFSDPMVLGSIDIVDGSSYMFQGKKFVLEKSHIYLTGDPSKPLLDLTVKYKALRHLITIRITGTPSVPNVMFSSVPSLNKEQILSIILFDSEEGAGTNDANEMMKMMGGAMAKSALNDLGVKIDHLVFGQDGSIEIGKKITKNVTVIYINGEIPEMKVKYQYNPSLDVVIGASERSESIDAVYIKDFNLDDKGNDIVIKGREK